MIAFVEGNERVTALSDEERDLLPDLLAVRFTQNVLISVWRARRFPENVHYIAGFARPITREEAGSADPDCIHQILMERMRCLIVDQNTGQGVSNR